MHSSTQRPAGAGVDGSIQEQIKKREAGVSRRSFLASGVAVGVGAGLGPFGNAATALAKKPTSRKLTKGDAAILRFLSAAEILETDLWQQYNELAGIQDSEVPGGSGSAPYIEALEKLDGDMPQYIHDNTEDELTHFTFINAYLESRGAQPVNLDPFRNLPSSEATGAQQIGRLTNLMELTVDTTWWTRYRSGTKNPDFGDTLPPAVPGLAKAASRRSRATMKTSNQKTTSKRSRTPRGSILERSSRAGRASIRRLPSASAIPRCYGSCSASVPPRRCTSRPGATRLVTPRR